MLFKLTKGLESKFLRVRYAHTISRWLIKYKGLISDKKKLITWEYWLKHIPGIKSLYQIIPKLKRYKTTTYSVHAFWESGIWTGHHGDRDIWKAESSEGSVIPFRSDGWRGLSSSPSGPPCVVLPRELDWTSSQHGGQAPTLSIAWVRQTQMGAKSSFAT